MQKREFTSFDVAAVVGELKKLILDSRVSNIYQPDNKTLLFKLHKPEKPVFWLLFEAGKRLHLTSYTVEKPATPPAFCMALRKYLRNSVLSNIEQYEFERVVIFSFKTGSGNLKLVLEIFGDGNAVLIDENNVILHALTYKRMRDRNILRGEKFAFAPPSGKNPLKISAEEFCEELKGFGKEVVRALARYLSIGGFYAEEVLLRTGVDKTRSSDSLEEGTLKTIFNTLCSILSQVLEGKLESNIILDMNGKFLDLAPIKLKRYEGFNAKPFESFNGALDEFYLRIRASEKVEETSAELETLKHEAERLKRIIESQERVLIEAQKEVEHYKRIGDTIYANSNMLQQLLDRFLTDLKSGKNWKEIISKILAEKEAGLKPSIFFESFDPKKLTINLCVDNLRFSLLLHLKLFDSATKFYEQSKKAKQRLEGAKKALEETRKKLADIETKIKEFEAKTAITVTPSEGVEKEIEKRRIKSKKWYEKFRWFKTSEDFLVVAGKDAVSNEVLIKKYTAPEDIVFHADIIGAPFTIVKTEGKTPGTQSLEEAAEFAAAHSRGWREGFATVDVYWVKPEQVSKTAPSGEYIPHGAFIISGKRNWMRNTPLKIAIGTLIDEEKDAINFIAGPVDAVKAKTQNYVVIIPGNTSVKELSKQILKKLAEKAPKEKREKIQKTTFEKVRELIPYGKGMLKTQPQTQNQKY